VYDAGLRSGGILIGIEPRPAEDTDIIEKLLADLGAEHVRRD